MKSFPSLRGHPDGAAIPRSLWASHRSQLPWLAILATSGPMLDAATVDAIYNHASAVPIVASSYDAAGNTIQFGLDFAPAVGTSLTVIRMTGSNFIQGRFDNLAHGQRVVLDHDGRSYYFIANYHGHEGRDLVLQWENVRPQAWGSGTGGQLGDGELENRNGPVGVHPHGALWGKIASSGAAGGAHSLGIATDGTVFAWGTNTNGQLGNGTTNPSTEPVAVTIPGVPSPHVVVAVAAGTSHSLALRSDGRIYAWGLNTNGRLGNNSTTQSTVPVEVSRSGVLAGRTIVAISAGGAHNLALCSDGFLASWGLSTNGQLGNNTTTQSLVPVAVTTASGALNGKSVIAISAGSSHSLALCSDGTVAAWGLNANGQLGNNSTTQSNIPASVYRASGPLNGRAVTRIAAGGSHSLALCSDGTLAAWGLNGSGQLGNGTNLQSTTPVAVSNAGVLLGRQPAMISAGASHSLALCTDGTLASWGANASGQLGNGGTSPSNLPVVTDPPDFGSGIFSSVTSGSSANHNLALAAYPEVDLSYTGISKRMNYVQNGTANPVPDADSPFVFFSYANSGPMSQLLPDSVITPPVPSQAAPFYERNSMGLQIHRIFHSKAALDSDYPTGTYLVRVRTSTPNTYDIPIVMGAELYPSVPKITAMTNATWINGVLKITNRANPVTLTWSNPANHDTYFQINNTGIFSEGGGPLTQFTIPGGSLDQDTFFRGTIQFRRESESSPVPEVPDLYVNSAYEVHLNFLIQVGTPETDPPMHVIMKEHNQVQYSNGDPVDTPNRLSDADLAPYAMSVETPSPGTLTGPSSTSFPLGFTADTDGPGYVYYSPPAASSAQLAFTHPNGTYVFPGPISVSLTGESYPAVPKILTVNGAPPAWNAQGHLVLDPTIEHVIAWSAVTVPDFATHGYQEVEFYNYQDFGFSAIEGEYGPLAGGGGPVTTMIIPASSMTPTFTYIGRILYAKATGITPVGIDGYAIAAYESSNQFMAVAMKPQSIDFPAIPAKSHPGLDFALEATSTSGLPVTYEIVSGPAVVSGNMVTLVGTGMVTVRAGQEGDGMFTSAIPLTRTFEVSQSSALAAFREANGLAQDGSEDELAPAGDNIANLLKFAFNMLGTGPGQAPDLLTPNVSIIAVAGTAGLPRPGDDGGRLTLTYVRRKASTNPGIQYEVEFSSELSGTLWSTNPLATETPISIDPTWERVTVTDHAPFPRRFGRVRVTAD